MANYLDENSLKFEITCVNLSEKYKKSNSEAEKLDLNNSFETRKSKRITELNQELENETKKKQILILENELSRVKNLNIKNHTKEVFGEMVLLITRKLAQKSCFANYSLNWKHDFFSRAIEHSFRYIHNFDENKISQRTGKPIKAFAYLTQIIYTGFLDVISKFKKDEEKLRKLTNIQDIDRGLNILENDKLSVYSKEIILEYPILDFDILKIEAQEIKNFIHIIDELGLIKSEKYLLSQTPEKDKTQDYYTYKDEINTKYYTYLEKFETYKEKYKISVKPDIIKIYFKEYKDESEISKILKLFDFSNISCILDYEMKGKKK